MSQVIISVTLHGDVEGGVDDESGFYFELEKALGQVAQQFGLNAHIDDVHDNADGGLMQPDNFEKAWNIVKGENPNSDWDEPDDSPHAGTSKCPCRQGFNSCDHPKCREAHSKNPNSKSNRGN